MTTQNQTAPMVNRRFIRVKDVHKVDPFFPVKVETIRAWASRKRFPGLFRKVGHILFIDMVKWDEIVESSHR